MCALVTGWAASQSYRMASIRPLPVRWYTGLAPFLPWTDGTGRAWPRWSRLPRVAAFNALYLPVAWALFVVFARREDGVYSIDEERLRNYVYAIPDLGDRPLRVLGALLTAPFLNHNHEQLLYVTVLLLAFGAVFEVREGTLRTAALFLGTTWVGAIVAGVLLHAVHPGGLDYDVLNRAWYRTWSGGSAGCYGLMGALTARAQRPWLLGAIFVLWELNLAYWYLKHYTPAFHLTAFATGYLVTRCWLLPIDRSRAPSD